MTQVIHIEATTADKRIIDTGLLLTKISLYFMYTKGFNL